MPRDTRGRCPGMKANKNKLIILSVILVLSIFAFYKAVEEQQAVKNQDTGAGEEILENLGLDELNDGYFTLLDDDGNPLLRTARIIRVGNQYHTSDNKLYEVHTVQGHTAYARYVKDVDLAAPAAAATTTAGSQEALPVQQQESARKIGIYHTHGAESYVPSDGADSIEEGGGILRVGEIFAQALKKSGVQPLQSKETHVPHDAGAYDRSRRTAEELLKENPDAIFDVHRDAVPAEEYSTNVKGEQVAQIQLVVGQQNQNQGTIQEFAEQIKRVNDEKNPGLIKGIFYASGNYNQDLSPRSLLLEVGTHESTREQAEEAIVLFADATTAFLYGDEPEAKSGRAKAEGTANRSILWLLLAAALAGGIFLYISTGSWKKAGQKLRQFTSTEFLNYLGRRPRPPRKDDPPPDDFEGHD